MSLLFYILVWTLAIPNSPILAFHAGPFTLLKWLGIVCLLAAIFTMIRMGKCPPLATGVKSRWFIAYFLVALISCFAHDGVSAFQTDALMFTISTCALFLMTLTFVTGVEHLRWAVLVAMGSTAWGSLYVIRQWQHFHGMYADFRTFGGLAGDPNYYAVTVVLWSPLILLWLLGKRPLWERCLCVACLLPVLLGFILAASRGGFLGLMVALLFLIWHARHRVRAFVIVAVLMLPILLSPGHSAFHRLLHPDQSDEQSSQYRLDLWQSAANNFLEYPIFGVGLGHFRPWLESNGRRVYLPFHVAHNTYIGLGAELGLAGLLPFVFLLVGSQVRLRRIRRQLKSPQTPDEEFIRRVALGLQAGLLGYIICAFFLSTLWVQIFWFALFLSMGLTKVQASLQKSPQESATAQGRELASATA